MRTREFNTEEVLTKAVNIFWLQGFKATSMQDLQDVMRVKRQSLYNAFNNKHDLYIEALKHYHRTVIINNFHPLFTDPSPLKAIKSYFYQRVKDIDNSNVINGCFVTNSVAELGVCDEEVRAQTRHTLSYMESAFRSAIERGQQLGEISKKKDSKLLAILLLNNAQGLFVLGKSGTSTRKLKKMVNQFLKVLN